MNTEVVPETTTTDLSTHAGLKAALEEISTDPRGWNGQIGTELLELAAIKFRYIAQKESNEKNQEAVAEVVSDAVTTAWRVWADRNSAVHQATSAWGWTKKHVQHALKNSEEAKRALTSTGRVKDGDTKFFRSASPEPLEWLAANWAAPASVEAEALRTPALIAARQIALDAGWKLAAADALIEHCCTAVADAKSIPAAIGELRHDVDFPAALGMPVTAFRAFIALLLGTERERGANGLLTTMAGGLELAEALETKSIRLAVRRFHAVAPSADAQIQTVENDQPLADMEATAESVTDRAADLAGAVGSHRFLTAVTAAIAGEPECVHTYEARLWVRMNAHQILAARDRGASVAAIAQELILANTIAGYPGAGLPLPSEAELARDQAIYHALLEE